MEGPREDLVLKARERRARATVAGRVADYYNSIMKGLDADAEDFFDRVMAIDAERRSAGTHSDPSAVPNTRSGPS